MNFQLSMFVVPNRSDCCAETLPSYIIILTYEFSTWTENTIYYRCGPCRYIGPIFEQLSDENDLVDFYSCDVDSSGADGVAAICNISAMPTFQFYKDGEKVDEMMGADQRQLMNLIDKHDGV